MGVETCTQLSDAYCIIMNGCLLSLVREDVTYTRESIEYFRDRYCYWSSEFVCIDNAELR